MNTFIRFKDIPENEISGIYDGDLGRIGDECGVCCYKATKEGDFYKIVLPSLGEGVLYDLLYFLRDLSPIYLITGDMVGIGSYGEPALKNITIIEEMECVELANPKPKFKMDKSNIQFKIKEG